MRATPHKQESDKAWAGRGCTYGSILETVGATPLVQINRLAEAHGAKADIFAKLEFFNPQGSVKDRMAVAILEAMEAAGEIGPGSVIVEPTSGNTGIGLAYACAAKGYRCILTMPDSMSIERRRMIRFAGAELVLTPKEKGINGSVAKAEEIVASTPGAVMPGQFTHPANPEVHRQTTALEIWNDTQGAVDVVVISTGTGGTLTGIGERLKSLKPEIKVVAVEPASSPVISGGQGGPHMIQGIGPGFIPENLHTDIIDEVVTVANEDAFERARELARLDGIAAGISSGAVLDACLQLAQRDDMAGKCIVTLLPDSAERYVSTALFDHCADD
ncbi:MAG: cysteine synthase A [Alphaproteobacteria bacterium]|nr:MAG: cysteine synthase A [Alphaproteobacteria bacterium]